MADEPVDERPRRRLFGRRRVESVKGQPVPGGPADQVEPGRSGAGLSGAELPGGDFSSAGPEPTSVAPTATLAAPAESGAAVPERIEIVPPVPPTAGVADDEEAMVTANPQPIPTLPEPVAPEPVEPVPAAGADDRTIARPPDEEPDPGLPGTTGVRGDGPVEVAAPTDADASPDVLPLPRVIAIANQKGGVGKTTTAVNLGAALAELGYRVLVVDLDPQGNASTGLGINPRDVASSTYDVIMSDTPALDSVEPTSLKNLFVLPATIDLAGADIELVAAFSRELRLRRALEPVRDEYDVILIDCPPSLGLLTVNGLAAADDVIVPVQSEYYALEGLGQLLKNVAMVRSVNPTLDVRGIVLTMHDSRTKLAEQVESEVREHFGARVYRTVVPRTVRLSEAPSFGQPIIVFDPTSRGATAYRELAKEVSGGATRRAR
jgi:chromosome partitioning protein